LGALPAVLVQGQPESLADEFGELGLEDMDPRAVLDAGDPNEHTQTPAYGQSDEDVTEKQLKKLLKMIDKRGNRDKKIDLEEVFAFYHHYNMDLAQKNIGEFTDAFDKDNDGMLTLDEMLTSLGEQGDMDEEDMEERAHKEAQKFELADADGDGYLNEQEIIGLAYPELNPKLLEFQTIEAMRERDQDGDMVLDIKEMWLTADEYGDAMEEDSINEQNRQTFKAVDKNGDGDIDVQELMPFHSGRHHMEEGMKALFKEADNNRDKKLTAKELANEFPNFMGTETQYHISEWVAHFEL